MLDLLKVNNKNNWTTSTDVNKGVFIVNFEHIQHICLIYLLLL